MSELSRIAAELERAYKGDAWHGPNMTVTLKGLRAFCAPVKPIPEAHSIWEIVHHLTAWNEIVRRRFCGELVKVTPEQDWPAVEDTGQEAWERDLGALHQSVQSFIAELKRAAKKKNCDEVLKKKVRGKTHNVYVMLH